jgi:integrase
MLRYQVNGKRRDLGLGSFDTVTLANAREAARAARAKLAAGIDPIEDKKAIRSKLVASQAATMLFSEASTKYIASKEPGWRSAKHAQQVRNTLAQYAFPFIGRMNVTDIEVAHILKVLEPIWYTKPQTADRVRGRIKSVLDWVAALGLRTDSNPARWEGHLEKLLPSLSQIAETIHYRALPFSEMPTFMKALRLQEGMGAKALEFTILTAARSGEVRGAKWDEFDLDAGVWTVPATRMKAGKEHRVPLSDAAHAVVKQQQKTSVNEYVFPSPRKTILSDMSLTAVLRRMGTPAVPHGFRSTFRDWCAESTDFPRDVAEMALAHAIGNKVEAAYRRGDLFEKRKQMMQEWADFSK